MPTPCCSRWARSPGSLALLSLLLVVLLPWGAEGFLSSSIPSSSTRRQPGARRLSGKAADEEGGKGFLLRSPPPPPNQEEEAEAVRKEWERAYKAYIKKNGAQLCALAWRGYQKEGRGAIVAKQREPQPNDPPEGVDAFEGVASAIFVGLARWVEGMEAAAAADGAIGLQSSAMRLILDRVRSYTPKEDFVVVFETPRLCGADIVHPSVAPPVMADRLLPEEEGAGNYNGVEDRGAINVEVRGLENDDNDDDDEAEED